MERTVGLVLVFLAGSGLVTVAAPGVGLLGPQVPMEGEPARAARMAGAAVAVLGAVWLLARRRRPREGGGREPDPTSASLAMTTSRTPARSTLPPPLAFEKAAGVVEAILDEVCRALVGKREVIRLILAGLVADGHVLLDDVPGVAKTLTARSIAAAAGLDFSRVQFTPDVFPTDITGSLVLDVATQQGSSQRTGSSRIRATESWADHEGSTYLRFSPSILNDEEDVDRTVEAVEALARRG